MDVSDLISQLCVLPWDQEVVSCVIKLKPEIPSEKPEDTIIYGDPNEEGSKEMRW